MTSPINTITALLLDLADKCPDKFPGADTDPSKNARVYVEGLALLRRTCEPLYESAAQASLMKDVGELITKISNSDFKDIESVKKQLQADLYKKLRFLNGHGVKHLHVVDVRARQIVDSCRIQLTPYEVFFLAASLTIHDAGLIFGRDSHEKSIHAILSALNDTFAKKRERDAVERIAGAHGGHVPGEPTNKATIDVLNKIEQLQGAEIRPQLLAAIVRLADELAEDHTRHTPIPGETPQQRREALKGSEIFHVYSRCLEPCLIKGQERLISLQFLLDREDVRQTFLKGEEEVYLLDEIFDRTVKCFAELTYCGRLIQESVTGDKIDLPPNEIRVQIEVASDDSDFEPLTLRYALKAKGYPDVSALGIPSFAQDITDSLKEYAQRKLLDPALVTSLLQGAPSGSSVARLFNAENPTPSLIADAPASPSSVGAVISAGESKAKNFIKRLLGTN